MSLVFFGILQEIFKKYSKYIPAGHPTQSEIVKRYSKNTPRVLSEYFFMIFHTKQRTQGPGLFQGFFSKLSQGVISRFPKCFFSFSQVFLVFLVSLGFSKLAVAMPQTMGPRKPKKTKKTKENTENQANMLIFQHSNIPILQHSNIL